tara:strand:+ start:8101 stop:8604 length:504 start_codon:yes stop_codon:yes gene_type:complete
MEKRIEQKIALFINEFKNDIKAKLEDNDEIDFKVKGELLKYIFDYSNLVLEKEDFTKRKRVKSSVPQYMRCMAKRASGEQCTRKKKEGFDYCGTHDKNRPHGIVSDVVDDLPNNEKREVWIQEINGIIYYIDNQNNIYKTEDIISNKISPNIIGKYYIENNKYFLVK